MDYKINIDDLEFNDIDDYNPEDIDFHIEEITEFTLEDIENAINDIFQETEEYPPKL